MASQPRRTSPRTPVLGMTSPHIENQPRVVRIRPDQYMTHFPLSSQHASGYNWWLMKDSDSFDSLANICPRLADDLHDAQYKIFPIDLPDPGILSAVLIHLYDYSIEPYTLGRIKGHNLAGETALFHLRVAMIADRYELDQLRWEAIALAYKELALRPLIPGPTDDDEEIDQLRDLLYRIYVVDEEFDEDCRNVAVDHCIKLLQDGNLDLGEIAHGTFGSCRTQYRSFVADFDYREMENQFDDPEEFQEVWENMQMEEAAKRRMK